MPCNLLLFSLLLFCVTLSSPVLPVVSSLEVPVKPPLQMRCAFQPHPHHRLLKYWGNRREAELEDVSAHIQGFYQLDDRGTPPPTTMIKTANIANYQLRDMI